MINGFELNNVISELLNELLSMYVLVFCMSKNPLEQLKYFSDVIYKLELYASKR